MSLHKHARMNDESALKKDLKSGVNVNERDKFGAAPLHYALSESNCEIAVILIEHGADVSCTDGDGKTPLHYAIEYEQYELAEKIISADAKVVHVPDNDGNTPLWAAVFNAGSSVKFVELLLKNEASAKTTNRAGRSPSDLATKLGDTRLIELLTSADV
ncbi:MAG: ankyrin repeat domain-containing protein [Rubripirellula sp.]